VANEIEAALLKYGVGSDHRMCKAIHFSRLLLIHMAQAWLRLADQAERNLTTDVVAAGRGKATISSRHSKRS
jgi:hypothetical protein